MLMPWITLGLINSAIYARLSRAQMLETLSEDYIRTARAKGLPTRASTCNTPSGRRSPRSSRSPASTSAPSSAGW